MSIQGTDAAGMTIGEAKDAIRRNVLYRYAGRVMLLEEVAAAFGVTVRTLRGWSRTSGLRITRHPLWRVDLGRWTSFDGVDYADLILWSRTA